MNLDDEPGRERHIQIYDEDRKVPHTETEPPSSQTVRDIIVNAAKQYPNLSVDRIFALIRKSTGRHDISKAEIRFVLSDGASTARRTRATR
jgi:hypothetical protein